MKKPPMITRSRAKSFPTVKIFAIVDPNFVPRIFNIISAIITADATILIPTGVIPGISFARLLANPVASMATKGM